MNSPPDDRLRLLQAEWVLGKSRPEQIADVCMALLEDGNDTPTLRLLAGTTRAEMDEVRNRVPDLFSELGMEEPTKVRCAWTIVEGIANDIVAGRTDPVDGGRRIGSFAYDFAPLFPALGVFIGLWSEWDDQTEYRTQYEADIRAEAARLLLLNPPPEPGTGSETDRLIQAAVSAANSEGFAYDFPAVIKNLVSAAPAGHQMLGDGIGPVWAVMASHRDNPILFVHSRLPFGFIRPERLRYVEVVANESNLMLAEVGNMESAEISMTNESLAALAGRPLDRLPSLDWLSADEVRKITEATN